jgi:hypothetical protein
MYPLSSAKIRLSEDADADAALYVNVVSLHAESERLCFSNVQLEAYTIQTVRLEYSGELRSAEIQLWSSGGVAYSDQSRHAKYVSEILEEYSKKFVTALNLDNKKESAPVRPPTVTQSWPGSPTRAPGSPKSKLDEIFGQFKSEDQKQ